jgi:TolB-like protein/DNA-binding winged helix-turn-helix (wHTH) protein/Tfp pilus assembly protein PilF
VQERSLAIRIEPREVLLFGNYEFDCHTGELRRGGTALKLQPQPAKVLSILVRRAGDIVTREELTEQVWGSETYVDFEHGLNFAIRKIRTVLEDDPDQPTFVETIPKRGYRFIAAVTNPATGQEQPQVMPAAGMPTRSPARRKILYAGAAIVLAVIFGLSWYHRNSIVGPANARQIRSLAVLPLRNLSDDPSQEYFSDGMTDELITDLAKARGLRVISHTSVERFKGTKLSLPEIARQLGGVDAVVEGTILRSGDRIRITAQLIDARSDQHLWANSYDRSLRDVLSTENQVSQSIAQTIELELSGEARTYLASARPINPEAHDAYLKGRFFWSQRSEPDLKKAIDSFQLAIAKDPNYAPAYSGLADTYFYLGYAWGKMPPTEAMPLARAAASRAVELDPNSAEAHTSLAMVELTYDWNFPGAEQEFKRAIALNPNYEWAHHAYSGLLIASGRPEQAILEARKAVETDPLSVPARNILALELMDAGHLDESIQEDLKTLEIDPNPTHLAVIHSRLQDSYRRKGMPQESFEEHIKTLQANGVDSKGIDEQRKLYAENGWRGIHESDLKSALANWKKEHWHFNAFMIAEMYARMGHKDQAFAWLNQCLALHSTMMIWIDSDPGGGFGQLRSDPRFAELKRKMGMTS